MNIIRFPPNQHGKEYLMPWQAHQPPHLTGLGPRACRSDCRLDWICTSILSKSFAVATQKMRIRVRQTRFV